MTAQRGIVCAGNWIVDIIHDISHWPEESDLVNISGQTIGVGGGAANVAFNLAALQVDYPVLPAGLLGHDNHGELVRSACHEVGLPVEQLSSIPKVCTAHTHVMNVQHNSRTFFYNAGANAHFDEHTLSMKAIAKHNPSIFYLGYLNLLPLLDASDGQGRTGAAKLLAQARAVGMITCVDLVSSLSDTYAKTVMGTLLNIDWLFLNEVEASRATGVILNGEEDRTNMSRAASKLMSGGLGQGCVLHTPKLTLWKTVDDEIWYEVPQIPKYDIISPVGAGDAFAAGILHGLHENWSAHDCICLGNKMAAACLRAPTATGGILTLKEL